MPRRTMMGARPAGGATETTVHFEEDFTATTTGDLGTNNAAVNEVGNPASGDDDLFVYQPDGSGVACVASGGNGDGVVWETDGREDVRVTCTFILDRGSGIARYQGVALRNNTGTDFTDGFFTLFWDTAGDGDPEELALLYGAVSSTSREEIWDITGLATPPVEGDRVTLVFDCEGNDITWVSIEVNGGGPQVVNLTHTMRAGLQANHGAGSGADWYGIASNERSDLSSERFEYLKVESIPA